MSENRFKFMLDTMIDSKYPFPDYVNYAVKAASTTEKSAESELNSEATDYSVASREQVWLSALKLACFQPKYALDGFEGSQDAPTIRYATKRVKDAAIRYGILEDLNKMAEFVVQVETRQPGIRSEAELKAAKNWLSKNAEYLGKTARLRVLADIEHKEAEFGYVPTLQEKYDRAVYREENPVSEDMEKFAEANLHELATGKVYSTFQFEKLAKAAATELRDCLPALVKTASLGTFVPIPEQLGKHAALLREDEACLLDLLMEKHGQVPLNDTRKAAVVIETDFLKSFKKN